MTAPTSHFDLERAAALDAGTLPPSEAAAARQHADGCPDCSRLVARVGDIRAQLAALPAAPMPTDVWDRVGRAIADAPAPVNVLPVAGREVSTRRSWLRRPAAAALAAAATVAALVAAVLVGAHVHNNNSPRPRAGAGPNPVIAPNGAASPDLTAFRTVESGQVYAPPDAPEQLARTLARPPIGAAGPKPAKIPAALRPFASSQQRVLGCLTGTMTNNQPEQPLLVDLAQYAPTAHAKPQPVLVVFLPTPDSATAEAWVLTPDCATAPDNGVRYYARLPMPR